MASVDFGVTVDFASAAERAPLHARDRLLEKWQPTCAGIVCG